MINLGATLQSVVTALLVSRQLGLVVHYGGVLNLQLGLASVWEALVDAKSLLSQEVCWATLG